MFQGLLFLPMQIPARGLFVRPNRSNQNPSLPEWRVEDWNQCIEDLRQAHRSKKNAAMNEEKMTRTTMNEEIKSYKPVFVIHDDTPKVKKFDLRLDVTNKDLRDQVKKAFDLARIAGHELDIIFSQATS